MNSTRRSQSATRHRGNTTRAQLAGIIDTEMIGKKRYRRDWGGETDNGEQRKMDTPIG